MESTETPTATEFQYLTIILRDKTGSGARETKTLRLDSDTDIYDENDVSITYWGPFVRVCAEDDNVYFIPSSDILSMILSEKKP